nr:lysophospholipid acyltransferase family protein [Spongiibacter thalassae]
MHGARQLLKRLRRFSKPVVTGIENIPEAPALFVANHSTMAGDTIVAVPILAESAGRVVRGMNDRAFYENPRLRKLSINNGGVMGHPDIGSALFEANKDVLVFPGGAYEANKNLDLRYTIQWKERTGFVRLAAKHGVPIVPMGIVGPDEWYDRYLDRDELRDSVFGKILRRAGVSEEYMNSDLLPPIPRGFMGTLLPKWKQVFVHFGKPIKTGRYKGKNISQASQFKLRDQTKAELEASIEKMLKLREEMQEDKPSLLNKLGW